MEQIAKEALWVFCETQGNNLLPVGMQLLGRARELADERQRPLYAIVLGPMPEDCAKLLKGAGADKVICSDGENLGEKLEQPYADCLIRLSRQFEPEILLAGATPFGRAFFPRVAAALEAGLTADCTILEIDEETGLLHQTRPAFGGNMMATIKSIGRKPQMATVRPNVMPMPELKNVDDTEVIMIADEGKKSLVKLIKETAIERSGDITKSKVIVAAGRGIGEKKSLKLVQELADKLGGSVGSSRPLVDMGYCPYGCQIGQTGNSVGPDLLICCGVSGAVQFLAGIGGAKTIVAINSDPKAPIFSVADYQIVGDCIPVIQELIKAID